MKLQRKRRVILELSDYKSGHHHNWEAQLHVWVRNCESRDNKTPTDKQQVEWLERFLSETPWAEAHEVVECAVCAPAIRASWAKGVDPFKCPEAVKGMLTRKGDLFSRGTRGKAQRLVQLPLPPGVD